MSGKPSLAEQEPPAPIERIAAALESIALSLAAIVDDDYVRTFSVTPRPSGPR